jgi:hypothetical protein
MANTDSSRSRQDREQTELWPSSSQQSSLDNGISRTGEDGEVTEERWQFNESRYPLYPPGPRDRDGWNELIGFFPELEPTFCKEGHMLSEMQKTESCIHRTLNGPTTGVDLRLRAVGNGVVPAVAAVAFRELANKLKKDGNFPNILYDDRVI